MTKLATLSPQARTITPACMTSTLDWTPEHETIVIPTQQRTLCTSCPLRAQCLEQALANNETGYWGGTTTAERDILKQRNELTIAAADVLYRERVGESLHPGKPASNYRYRCGCRCNECRQINTEQRRKRLAKR